MPPKIHALVQNAHDQNMRFLGDIKHDVGLILESLQALRKFCNISP